LQTTDNLSRLERLQQKRARYRRRRFVAVAILAGLFFGIGAQAGVFFHADRIDAENSGNRAATAGSSGVVPISSHSTLGAVGGPTTIPEEDHGSAYETTEGLVASRSQEPTTEDESASEAKRGVTSDHNASKDPEEASDEPLNVLVMGVDRRPSAAEGSSARSDTIMLVQVTPGTGRVELLSVPRDLYVEVEPGYEDRINTAYTYGGIDRARAVMEGLTGVQIDNYVIVDFEGFEEIINAIGGVKVDVGHDMFPEKWHMGDGVQRLGGRKALFYARYRGTPRADLDRIEHQQKLLSALRRQAFRWNTVTKVPQIVKVANENVDTDLGLWRVISLGRTLVLHGRDGKLTAHALKGNPTYLPNGMQVLMPDDEANERILQDFRQ
jgi:polyisoprenyl-teichoic acid--peptidoglycan teichoic acid transferase